MIDIMIAALCYIVPTFPLGYVWHLTLFKERYRLLEVYREDISPPLGIASMIVQGIVFGFIYVGLLAPMATGWIGKAAAYAALGGFLSWSFTTLAWAAKGRLTSLRDFFALETTFTVIQWVIVGAITALLVG